MNWTINQTVDLSRGYTPEVWPDALMVSGDDQAHTWRVAVMNGGVPAVLTGAVVTGYFVRADGVTVAISGTAAGNIASATMSQNCYAVEGRLGGVMRIELNGRTVTLSSVIFTVKRLLTDEFVDPGQAFWSIEAVSRMYNALHAQVQSLASGSPAGAYADLAALIADDPDHSKIYITLDDGKWCYHNGTTWVAGGVYQATGIADGVVTPAKTSFAQPGKNLWNGVYLDNARLAGAMPYRLGAYTGAKAIVFKGTPGKTYTISRSQDTAGSYHLAVFNALPVIGGYCDRVINDGGIVFGSRTVTLAASENYIVLTAKSESAPNLPAWVQIEEGSQATAYHPPGSVVLPYEPGSVPFAALKQAEVSITPEMTTFITRGKNLWSGEYVADMRLGGVDPFDFREVAGAKSVVFEGEPGQTYTISRPANTPYYHTAVYSSYPVLNGDCDRVVNDGAIAWTSKTITLSGTERYIVFTAQAENVATPPAWLQIEQGAAATTYEAPGSLHMQVAQQMPRLNAVKAGNVLSIYVPSRTDPNRYLRHTYNKLVNAEALIDTWVYNSAGIFTKFGDTYGPNYMISPGNSDNEGVLRISGEGDFIGGKHGYDIMEDMSVIIDGNDVDMSGDFNLNCSHINIMVKSRVLHDSSTDIPENKAFTRYKMHVWDLNGMTLEGRWVAEKALTLSSSVLCDFSVEKTHSGVSIACYGRNDVDYIKRDVSGTFGSTPYVHGVKRQEIWSESAGFYLGLSCDFDMGKYENSHAYIEELGGTRAKIYFNLTGNYSIEAGEDIRYTNHYDFRF